MKKDWDEPFPNDISNCWRTWTKNLVTLTEIVIPRRLKRRPSLNTQLHVFSDAPKAGFSAVAYLGMKTATGVTVSFVLAKSRVAPTRSFPPEVDTPDLFFRYSNLYRLVRTVAWIRRFMKLPLKEDRLEMVTVLRN